MNEARITRLWRWPVKGLGGESLAEAQVEAGGLLPFDRAFAIENGPSGFDADRPGHVSKRHFVCMVHQPQTGRMTARHDDATGLLSIETLDGRTLVVDPQAPEAFEALASGLVDQGVRGPLRLRHAADRQSGHGFTDVPDRWISIQNLASIEAVGRAAGQALDPRRLRGNVLVEGWQAWQEEALVGRQVQLGAVRVEITEPINRCRAIDVNPETSVQDSDLVRTLVGMRGLRSLGVYARILEDGTLRVGNAVRAL